MIKRIARAAAPTLTFLIVAGVMLLVGMTIIASMLQGGLFGSIGLLAMCSANIAIALGAAFAASDAVAEGLARG